MYPTISISKTNARPSNEMKPSKSKQGLRLKSERRSIQSQRSNRQSSTDDLPTSAKMLSSLPTSELLTRNSPPIASFDDQEINSDNSELAQKVMNLKLRLSTALERIDDEQHLRRRQTEQIVNLRNENARLKSDLERACRQIVDLQGNDNTSEPKSDDSTTNNTCACTTPTDEYSERDVQGLLRRFVTSKASSISSTMCSNVESRCASSLASSSTSRRRSSLLESLADEELPPPPARRASSVCSSLADEELPNNMEQRRVSDCSLHSLSKPQVEEWLDERCILHSIAVQNTCTARRA